MSNQAKNHRIQTLEPSKLSQSIKSKNEEQKQIAGTTYENYFKTYSRSQKVQNAHQTTQRQIFTKTQQIYEANQNDQVDRRFKKSSAAQVDKLSQLKKQYEILRNMKIDDSYIYQQKPIKKQSSVEASENNSVRSAHTNSKIQQQQNHKNLGLMQYQRKQLQMMLANSMNKIEELLKAQVEYKRRIYDLTRLNPESPNDQWQQKLKSVQQNERLNQQMIDKLKFEEQKLRNLNFNLTERIRSIESEIFNLQTENRRMGDQKRKLQQSLMLQKQAHMNTKIEIKRYQLQKDMIQKQKNNEVERLKRTIKDQNTEYERLNGRFKKSSQQISTLNQKINFLTKQLTLQGLRKSQYQRSDKSVSGGKEYKEYKQYPKQLQRKQDNIGDNFQKKLMEKIKELEIAQQDQAKKQIHNLKEEIENLKFKQDQTMQRNHLQIRITALEKMINQDNQQKMGFLQQLRRIIKDFQELQMENQDLKQKIRKLQRQLNIEKQNSVYQMDRLQKSHKLASATVNSDDIHNYLTKIRRLQSQNRDLRVKLERMEDSYSNSESRIQQKIREYSRKIDQSQMQIQKLLKQNEFNLQLAQSKYKAEIQLSRNQAARALRQKNEEKSRYEQLRNSVNQKIEALKRQGQNLTKNFNQRLSHKEAEIDQIKKQSQQSQIKIKKQYQKQLFSLLARLDELIRSNQRYVMENARLLNIESDLYDLRSRAQKLMGLNQSVDHLWQVKQIQYFNLNALLKEIKGE